MKSPIRLAISSLLQETKSQETRNKQVRKRRVPVPVTEVKCHGLSKHSFTNTDEKAANVKTGGSRDGGLTAGRNRPDESAASDGGRGEDGFGKEGTRDGEGDVGDASKGEKVSTPGRGRKRGRNAQEHGECDRVVRVLAAQDVLEETHELRIPESTAIKISCEVEEDRKREDENVCEGIKRG
jgi:hypothetical protein